MTDSGPGEAVELAVTYISVVGETDKLGRAIKKELRDAQTYAAANPLKLTVSTGELRREVRELKGLHANVELRTTAAERNRFVSELNEKLKKRRILVYLTPVIDEQALRNRLNSLPGGTVKLDLEVTATEMNRFITDLRRRLRDANVTVPIGLNLTNEAAFRTRLEELTRNRSVDVNVDIDRSGLDRLQSALSGGAGLGGLTKGVLGASALSAGIAAIGGAAGAALGAVGALGVGIAALGPAAAAAGATVAVGLHGIGDAFKALSAAEDSAASDGKAQAKAVAAAQEQVQTALEGVETAQRNLSDAQKDARDATKDIADAYKDAREELEDYTFKVKDAALSEAEAKQALIEAREEFAKAPPKDREKAYLRLQRADLRYQEAVEKNKDTQQEANEAFQKGVEGSDKVVAAKERAAKADQRVTDAERQVQKAHEQVAKAQQAVADAANSGSAAQDKAAQALAKLSPNAQAFVLAAREAKPAWEELTHAVQDKLFDGAAQGISQLVTNSLPTLKAGMVDVAGSMNGLTKQFAAFWQAPENLEGVRAIFAGTANFIDGLGPGLQQATQGFLSLGQAFEPVANKVGAQFGGMLGQIGDAFTTAFNNGQLTQLISTFGDTLQGLGEGLNPLIQGLIQMGNIVGPTLGPFFAQLGQSIGALAPSLGQLGATFMTTLTAILPDLQKFIEALAVGLEPVLPVIGDLLQSLMTALTPLIPSLSQIAQVVGMALSQALTALAPAIGPIGEAFASLVTAIAPMIPVLAEVVSGILQALAPALTTIFDALAPVIKQWADLFMPVFKQLQPIIADVAMKIGTAIADALKQIAPYIPDIAKSFTGLVMALVPLLPQLVQLGVDLLPPMINLFIAILPQVLKLIDAFTWLANNVLVPILIPAIKGLSLYLSDQLNNAAKAVTTARDLIGGALTKMGSFFSGLGDTVKTAWDVVIRNVARGVKSVGEILTKAGKSSIPFPGREAAGQLGASLTKWADDHMATGGLLRGPGTGTSDSMLIAASTGEYIVNAAATSRNLPLLEAINSGWVPSAEFLHGMIPGFREGGQVPGKAFAQSMDSAKYLMGGFSRSAIDCSAMVSAVVNDALGLNPFDSRMSTVNEGQWLAAKGAKPGLGPAGSINIGWFDRGGGANGHTALTLSDGTNVESNGSEGVVIGGPVGADHRMFDKHMHIPADLLRGGDLGAGGTGTKGGRPSKLGGPAGSGTGGSGSGSGTPGSSNGLNGSVGATPVEVTNWPAGWGGPAANQQLGQPAAPGVMSSTAYGPDGATVVTPDSSAPLGLAPPAVTPNAGADSSHPLSGLPIPGFDKLFNGPAPWYLAATPEQAVANLGSQAASLAQKTGGDVAGFFQNNWREMVNSGLALAGMGATGGGDGGTSTTYNISGTDPMGAARAVERVHRRQTMVAQRAGGFGR